MPFPFLGLVYDPSLVRRIALSGTNSNEVILRISSDCGWKAGGRAGGKGRREGEDQC